MEQRPAARAAREAWAWLQTVTAVLVAAVLVFVFVGQPVVVDGNSMLPTLRDRELMLVRRVGYDPQPGDVVVLRKAFRDVTGPIVKRIIAVEGQRVEIDYAAGTVWVDGTALTEDYILEPMVQQSWQSITTLTVPEGCVFVMGDNRNISDDSRDGALGAVEEGCLLGKVELVLFPFQNFGGIS